MEQRAVFPDLVRPMLATAGALPDGPGWAFEFKWDGVRAVAYVLDRRLRLMTRNDLEVSRTYPEVGALGALVDGVVLDGEIVALEAGRPSFGRLQSRMHVGRPDEALLRRVPVVYYAFDLLHAGGTRLVDQPYERRRELLHGLALSADAVRVPPCFTGVHGEDVLSTARDHGLEGVVAKKVTSRYEPGRRSRSWVKVPLVRTREVVVGGWQPGDGRRAGTVGSLLLGVPGPDGPRYVGKVGTGFTAASLADLHERLRARERPDPPFVDAVPPDHARAAHWTHPDLVGEVEYRTFTTEGRLRHASWRGLRPDKTPDDIQP
ncbi:non-homologous end-joining DNA ligase [Saccharothrix australiensis]|uniref:DNA ligase (ATP) n=1 Tax=Saccharothrix australiensis TaxID=2072 RepID=A0A495W2N6_9PSEU|nr:non-homologous end-joining DNA ligase [Saccharothrix australiensis]RKT55390.1 bifunctional non-homologous end joining protein LigD [Saccharothrix australiensis]